MKPLENINHADWQTLQRIQGRPLTKINPRFLGRPFRLTDEQREALEPYIRAAGQGGAVMIICEDRFTENFMLARPVALTLQDRKIISRQITKAIKANNPKPTKKP